MLALHRLLPIQLPYKSHVPFLIFLGKPLVLVTLRLAYLTIKDQRGRFQSFLPNHQVLLFQLLSALGTLCQNIVNVLLVLEETRNRELYDQIGKKWHNHFDYSRQAENKKY